MYRDTIELPMFKMTWKFRRLLFWILLEMVWIFAPYKFHSMFSYTMTNWNGTRSKCSAHILTLARVSQFALSVCVFISILYKILIRNRFVSLRVRAAHRTTMYMAVTVTVSKVICLATLYCGANMLVACIHQCQWRLLRVRSTIKRSPTGMATTFQYTHEYKAHTYTHTLHSLCDGLVVFVSFSPHRRLYQKTFENHKIWANTSGREGENEKK